MKYFLLIVLLCFIRTKNIVIHLTGGQQCSNNCLNCFQNQTCVNNQCVDNCNCTINQACINNTCIDNIIALCNNSCDISQTCINGSCVDNTICVGNICFGVMTVPAVTTILAVIALYIYAPMSNTTRAPSFVTKAESLENGFVDNQFKDDILDDILDDELNDNNEINLYE